jgi:hypothetical protein
MALRHQARDAVFEHRADDETQCRNYEESGHEAPDRAANFRGRSL